MVSERIIQGHFLNVRNRMSLMGRVLLAAVFLRVVADGDAGADERSRSSAMGIAYYFM